MRRSTHVVLATIAGAGAFALATPAAAAPTNTPNAGPDPHHRPVVTTGSYAPSDSGRPALTYDEELVPVGAEGKVVSTPLPFDSTLTTFTVSGLQPNREYGAHVHTDPCGPTGDDAGPHFQNVVDPEQPSTDPEYANPKNEIWLDFTTDAHGNAHAVSQVPWKFEERRAGSVVIHDHHTHTDPGEAGEAGDRLACLTVDF